MDSTMDEPVGKRANLGSNKTYDEIWAAAQQGRTSDLMNSLASGTNLKEALARRQDGSGNSALHINSAAGNEEMVSILLQHTDDLNRANKFKQTPLMLAAEHGHDHIVKSLLEAGSEIERRDTTGATALLLAARCGCLGSVQELLLHDADVNARDNLADTALLVAATGAWVELVETLVQARANVDHRNVSGETALIRSAMHSDARLVQVLLDAGASVDLADSEMGFSALLFGSSLGREQVVSELLKGGADVNYTNHSGISALLLAARSGFLPVVKQLVKAGANVDHADAKGFTPLMVSAIGGYVEVVQFLINNKASINQRNYEGVTALSAAMEFGQKAVVDVLTAAGADPSAGVIAAEGAGPGSGQDFSYEASPPGCIPEECGPESRKVQNKRLPVESPAQPTDSLMLAHNNRQRHDLQQRYHNDYEDDNASVSTNGHEPGTIVRSPSAKVVRFHIPHPENPDDFYFYIPDEEVNDYDNDMYSKQAQSDCGCVIS